MVKKLTLVTALVVFLGQGVIQAQRNVNVNQRNQMGQGGMMNQFRMGMQVSPEEMLKFLKAQKFTEEAQKLEGLMKDPSKGQELQQELGRLNQVYGMVIFQMQRDPAAGKRALARIKLEREIEKTSKEAKGASGGAQAAARKKLAGLAGKLFDVVVAEEEARLKQMEEMIRSGNVNAMMGMGRGQGMGAGAGRGQGMGGQDRRMMGMGMGMGGQMNPEMLKQQLTRRKADIAAWKKNKAAIVNLRVQELLLDIPSFPWERGGMGMMRIFG